MSSAHSESSSYSALHPDLVDMFVPRVSIIDSKEGTCSISITNLDPRGDSQALWETISNMASELYSTLLIRSLSERSTPKLTQRIPSGSDHQPRNNPEEKPFTKKDLEEYRRIREESEFHREIRRAESISASGARSFGSFDDLINKAEEVKKEAASKCLTRLKLNQKEMKRGVTSAMGDIGDVKKSLRPPKEG